jgi:hypothetical protein
MQPNPLLARNTRQKSHSPISQDNLCAIDSAPNSQEDASGFGPCFFAGKLVTKTLIYERTQFPFVLRLN